MAGRGEGVYQEEGGLLSLVEKQHIYKTKSKSVFLTKSAYFTANYRSNETFCRKPDIIPHSVRIFWVGRFDKNPREKLG